MEELDQNEFTLTIKQDSLKSPFKVQLGGDAYILLSESEYIKMQEIIKASSEALIFKSLEKEILQEIPRDFDDVFVVAKTMLIDIQSKKGSVTVYDIKKIVKDIKLNYPNLFISIDEYFRDANI